MYSSSVPRALGYTSTTRKPFLRLSRPTIIGSENRKQNRFLLFVVLNSNPHKALASLVLFQRLPRQRKKKNVLFAHSTWLPPRVLDSHGTDHDQTWKVYAPLGVQSSLLLLRVVGCLCLEVSLRTWGADLFLYQLFAIQNRRSFPIGKNDTEMGQAPASERDLDTHTTYGPQT